MRRIGAWDRRGKDTREWRAKTELIKCTLRSAWKRTSERASERMIRFNWHVRPLSRPHCGRNWIPLNHWKSRECHYGPLKASAFKIFMRTFYSLSILNSSFTFARDFHNERETCLEILISSNGLSDGVLRDARGLSAARWSRCRE